MPEPTPEQPDAYQSFLELAAAASSLFSLFTSLTAAGFTERQAIGVMGEMLRTANAGVPPS